jgi:FMN phosphatase YigB (HAD superfamily)
MSSHKTVFLLDVDNTLLDNDTVIDDLKRHLSQEFKPDRQEHYWRIFDEHRSKYGYADYLGALQQYRIEHECDPHFMKISLYLLSYAFADRLYPASLEVIKRLGQWGPTVILSEGDVVFQPHKVHRSGLFEAVEGRVLIYIHKDCRLKDIQTEYPADRYVMVDDRLHILTAVKKSWGQRITTIFARQGHHAQKPVVASLPAADITIDSIEDLLHMDPSELGITEPSAAHTAF